MIRNHIYPGDCIDGMKELPDECVDMCVTSPPYYALRDYGIDGQIGLEESLQAFLAKLVEVFAEVHRIIKPEGTIWVNMGDTYAGSWGAMSHDIEGKAKKTGHNKRPASSYKQEGIKPKDLMGVPWRLAFALQDYGWYLRQDIIWHKPNTMPESVKDRCTKNHEYIFLLAKNPKYYFDQEAIKTITKEHSIERNSRGRSDNHKMADGAPGQKKHRMHKPKRNEERYVKTKAWEGIHDHCPEKSNKRSVWTVAPRGYDGAHFATFPEQLIVDCIKAGCPEGGVVLDPFMGAGTTALVARKLGRDYVGFELNPEYIAMADKRLRETLGLFI